MVLTCSIAALLRNPVLGSPLSFSGLGGSVWPSACNLITWLMLGAGGRLSPPVQHVQLNPEHAESPLGLEKLVPAGHRCQVCVHHPDQGFHLGSLLLCPDAVTATFRQYLAMGLGVKPDLAPSRLEWPVRMEMCSQRSPG